MLSLANYAFVMERIRGNLVSKVYAPKTTCFHSCRLSLDPI